MTNEWTQPGILMHPFRFVAAVIVLSVVVGILGGYLLGGDQRKCEAAGGHFINQGHVCISQSAVLP